jgi:D-sedoheptulose 7-phosphate isomerase
MAARRALDDLIADEVALVAIQSAARVITDVLARRGRVFSCGNGGSMCDAMHFAEELTGRFRKNRVALAAAAIADAAHLSCVANDFGYEHVFSRYLEAHAREGDCLVALSTSGSSKNVVHAAKIAQSLGVHVIGLTGHRDALLAPLCTVHVCTPAGEFSDRVQELHIKVLHILIELVERSMFPENYGADA